MLGPPMSMFSTMSSNVEPSFRTVCLNGYRLMTTISMVPMPFSLIASMCSGMSLLARIPACTLGWSVLTRPSSISGNPVTSETSFTSNPFSFRSLYVPPVDMISIPRAASSLAKSTIPFLSETLIIALLTVAVIRLSCNGEYCR